MSICHDKDYKGKYSYLTEVYLSAMQKLQRYSLNTNMNAHCANVFHTALPFLYTWSSLHEGQKFNFYKHRPTVNLGLTWEQVRGSAVYHAERRCNMGHGLLVYDLNLSRGSYKALFEGWPNEFRTALLPLAVDPYYLTRLVDMGDYKILITNKTSPEFFHRLSLLFPFLFPELNIPILMDLVKSYTSKNEDAFIQLGTTIIRELENKIARTNTQAFWTNFFAANQERTRQQLYNNKAAHEQEVDQLNKRLRDVLVALQQAARIYYAFESEGIEALTETIRYASSIAAIQDVATPAPGKVTFTFAAPCRNYDYDLVKQMLKSENPRSFWHKHRYPLSKIFLEEKHVLYIGSMLTVDFQNFTFHRAQNYTEALYTKGLPSPHFYVFDCWGMNKKPLLEALQKQDYIQFFTHMVSAASNLNFSEAGNMEALFTAAAAGKRPYDKPCVAINRSDTLLTWAQYLAYCKEEQTNENDATDT